MKNALKRHLAPDSFFGWLIWRGRLVAVALATVLFLTILFGGAMARPAEQARAALIQATPASPSPTPPADEIDLEPSFSITDAQMDFLVTDAGLHGVLEVAPALPSGPDDLLLNWFSPDADATNGVAWGDLDNDGDLDLAVGNMGQVNRVYRNEGGNLGADDTLVWSSREVDQTSSVVWGDVDGDGDLDLVAGNRPKCTWIGAGFACQGGQNRLYRNQGGQLRPQAFWSSKETDATTAVALGDVDGDGDLDLVVANGSARESCWNRAQCSQPSHRLYRNENGIFSPEAVWSSQETDGASALALTDVDRDGDLDLVASGFSSGLRTYLNGGDALETSASWTASSPDDGSQVLAVGDLDGDSYPELVTAAADRPLYLYDNIAGTFSLSPTWRSDEPSYLDPVSLAMGDYDADGDLDLAVGRSCLRVAECPLSIHRNEQGVLSADPAWQAPQDLSAFGLAWGDVDNDGDLDLAVGVGGRVGQPNQVYRNRLDFLVADPWWAPSQLGRITGVALGDVDQDGDLDVAVGYDRRSAVVYDNLSGQLRDEPIWTSDDQDDVQALAWGDLDGDGDLDLAVGNGSRCVTTGDTPICDGGQNRVYVNDGGMLNPEAVWSSNDGEFTTSVAWGDVDGDGDLDLVAGNEPACAMGLQGFAVCAGGANRIYLNRDGKLSAEADWISDEADATTQVAWGDMDNDGDLDLAAGNRGQPNRIYRNGGGTLGAAAWWSSSEAEMTSSLAWGDGDGDGDLDLAVGNAEEAARLYRNEDGRLTDSFVWSALEADSTANVAWGDVDGDGDLDLAVSDSRALRLYANEAGTLVGSATWSADMNFTNYESAWGDMDSDGDLDLVAGHQLFRGLRSDRMAAAGMPLVQVLRPPRTTDADFYSLVPIWSDLQVPVSYTMTRRDDEPVLVQGYFALNGAGYWQGADQVGGPAHQLVTVDEEQLFPWDVAAAGLVGQSDNVVFRLQALPVFKPTAHGAAGPYQYGSHSAMTFPFRVRGTQVRVFSETLASPVPGAIVYRLPTGSVSGAEMLGNASGPFLTDAGGYLQGRSTVQVSDTLYAMLPVSRSFPLAPWSYDFYHTSFTPTAESVEAYVVQQQGVQNLVVSGQNPLLLFNLDVSLEWDPRNDGAFLADLAQSIERSSEVLYDVSDGQIALGQVRVHPEKQNWLYSDAVVYASNSIRPRASQGGAVITATHDVALSGQPIVNAYLPGQIRMGPAWDPFGESKADLTEDWWRALAHEIGHYFLFLPDNYLGFDEATGVIRGQDCPGSFMTNAYDDAYSEFLDFVGDWPDGCQNVLAAHMTGRSDWATIQEFFPVLRRPGEDSGVLEGPGILPLEVTQVTLGGLDESSEVLPARNVDLRGSDDALLTVPHGQAYLFKTQGTEDIGDDQVIALGSTARSDRVKVRGAREGDRLCVFDNRSEPPLLGCVDPILTTRRPIRLDEVPGWQPVIAVSPVPTASLQVYVTLQEPVDNLNVQILPGHSPPTITVGTRSPWATMTSPSGDGLTWTATLFMDYPALEGMVRVWVPESKPLREGISQYYLAAGWGPISQGGWGPNSRGGWGPNSRGGWGPNSRGGWGPNSRGGWGPNSRGGWGPNSRGGWGPNSRGGWGVPARGFGANNRLVGAPMASSDGQVTIFNVKDVFGDTGTISLQALPTLPGVPAWLAPVGQGYRFEASGPLSRTIAFNYLTRDVPDGYEHAETLHLYYLPEDGGTWQRLSTVVDTKENLATAPADHSGIYALMAGIDIPLTSVGWNLVSFPVLASRPVTEALLSISDVYSTVYSFDSADPTDPWKVYDVGAPAWVNDLGQLEFGKGYWIQVSEPITLQLAVPEIGSDLSFARSGASVAASFLDLPSPPALYYGTLPDLQLAEGATAAMTATVGSRLCGSGTAVRRVGEAAVTYQISVDAAERGDGTGCGTPGATVTFEVDGQTLATTALWDNRRPLSQTLHLDAESEPEGRDGEQSTLTCRELVSTGGFETPGGWTLLGPPGGAQVVSDRDSADGAALQLDARAAAGSLAKDYRAGAQAHQIVRVPADATSVVLSYRYKTDQGVVGDVGQVKILRPTQSPVVVDSLSGADTWQEATVDITPYRGQRIMLVFQGERSDGVGTAAVWVDDVSILACSAPPRPQ